ncbi:TolC family protein [Alphaproteobacteria bacterium]|nr:TolC family protein [Alphaproteobacteria bacterium]
MKIFIIFLMVIFNSSYSYSLNIDEAIKSTIENNAKVKLALEKLEESKELVIYSSRENLPSITSTVTGTYTTADTDTATTSSTPETFTDSYKLVISKNIYDAGVNKLEIERSKILYNNELVNFESTIENLILDAIEGYLTVINYEKSLEATKKNYDAVLKAIEEIQTKFDLGSATLYELQESEASFAIAKTNLFAAEQNLLISKKTFNRIVGLNAINLNDYIEINYNIDLEDLTKNAFNNNLNLILLENEILNKEILILKEKKAKKANIDISGTAFYSDGSRLERGTNTTSGSIGLTITVPLYNKGQDNSDIRKYQSQKLQAEIQLQDQKDDLSILISNTYKNFKINESQMKANLSIIESIQTSLTSLIEEYTIGTKTITDLVEEEEKLLNANVNYLNSKKEYLLNYFKLKSLEGSLVKIFEEYLP